MTLAKAIDVAVGLAAVAVVAVLVKTLWLPPGGQELRPAREGVVSTAEDYPNLSSERATVVLIASASCSYCEASLPFYKTLTEHSRQGGRFDVAVLLPVNSASDELKAFFERAGVRDVRWVEGKPPSSISAVPALVVLDSSGKVQASWLGKMSGAQEQALIKLLAS